MTTYLVVRDVPASDPHNFLGRDVAAGETFEEFDGCTYGCIDWANGVALTSPSGSFFEFPRDAVVESQCAAQVTEFMDQNDELLRRLADGGEDS